MSQKSPSDAIPSSTTTVALPGNSLPSGEPPTGGVRKSEEDLLAEFYRADDQPAVRQLFKAFVDGVQDVTFGNERIAQFIRDKLLSVEDGVLKAAPSIQVWDRARWTYSMDKGMKFQSDPAFTWWIATLVSVTAKTMLSLEGLAPADKATIYASLAEIAPFLSTTGGHSMPKALISTSSTITPLPVVTGKTRCPGAKCPIRK